MPGNARLVVAKAGDYFLFALWLSGNTRSPPSRVLLLSLVHLVCNTIEFIYVFFLWYQVPRVFFFSLELRLAAGKCPRLLDLNIDFLCFGREELKILTGVSGQALFFSRSEGTLIFEFPFFCGVAFLRLVFRAKSLARVCPSSCFVDVAVVEPELPLFLFFLLSGGVTDASF